MRLLALAFAALPAAATTFELAHDVAEQHAVCPEHGELIHGDSAELASVDYDAVQSRSSGEESHEHCALLLATMEPASDVAVCTACTSLPAAEPQPLFDVGAPALPLLAVAPKSSPPASRLFAS